MVTLLRNRRGAGTLGCLFSLLIFAAMLYYGYHVGQVYWKFYQLQDAMKSQARLAPSLADDVIRRRLNESADDIYPDVKFKFNITRGGRPRKIIIVTEYADSVDLPLLKHTFPLTARAEEGI
jgi:hypothetical protein